jgi:hypothetical protein
MKKILQKENIKIYCELCKKVVENVWICKMDSIIGIRYALFCATCQKLIRISSSTDYKETVVIPSIIFNEIKTN